MTSPDSPEAYVDAAAAALGLGLDPAHRPGVITYFRLIQGQASQLMAFPLPAESEAAPVFMPCPAGPPA